MQIYPEEGHRNIWFRIASWIYRAGLCLYPKSFRKRFGTEMNEVFKEALVEHTQKGSLHTCLFLGREMIEAPISILNQHLAAKSFWEQPYPINILAFAFGFTLLGVNDVLNFYQVFNGSQIYLLNLLSYLLVGGLGGLAIGSILDHHRKKLFALSGAVGFLLANTLGAQLYFRIFPDAFTTTGSGIYFLIPFLYPILTGSIFGFFLGVTNSNWHGLFRYIGIGGLVLLAGFFVNRLSDALMQSYIFRS
ncbi:MAG TPA: hypothetical protein DCK95_04015, partial [Anaerolineaceae bacterium]|nr:hypothetical protein [Anaerolineaceae bacterium]